MTELHACVLKPSQKKQECTKARAPFFNACLVGARLGALRGLRFMPIWTALASFSVGLVVFPIAPSPGVSCLGFQCLFGALVRGLQLYVEFSIYFSGRQLRCRGGQSVALWSLGFSSSSGMVGAFWGVIPLLGVYSEPSVEDGLVARTLFLLGGNLAVAQFSIWFNSSCSRNTLIRGDCLL